MAKMRMSLLSMLLSETSNLWYFLLLYGSDWLAQVMTTAIREDSGTFFFFFSLCVEEEEENIWSGQQGRESRGQLSLILCRGYEILSFLLSRTTVHSLVMQQRKTTQNEGLSWIWHAIERAQKRTFFHARIFWDIFIPCFPGPLAGTGSGQRFGKRGRIFRVCIYLLFLLNFLGLS